MFTQFSVALFSGCSLGGFFIGKAIDDAKPDRDTVAFHRLEALPQFSSIEIIQKNGTMMPGKFIRLEPQGEPEYADVYEKFRLNHLAENAFPRLGDTILVQTYSSEVWSKFEFSGFAPGGVRAKRIPGRVTALLRQIHLQSATFADGTPINLGVWGLMLEENIVPFTSSLIVKTDSAEVNLSLNDVQRIERSYSKGAAKWIGLGIGICVDVALVAAGMSSMSFGFGKRSWK
jgi:hypothetical protein